MIPLFKVAMATDAERRVGEVLRSGHIAQGPIADQFESELHKSMGLYDGYKQELITVNSGTSAIHMALVLAGVESGDEVAVSPMTCAASVAPIIHLGARVVWIDVDPITGLISPESLKERLTWRTKAVIGIDWGGTPIDFHALRAVTDLPIIEDAAHAMFASRMGKPLGQWSYPNHYIAWSLQAIKHLTSGDGGVLLTPPSQIDRARKLRWFGLDRKSSKNFRCEQLITEAGYKYHMNDVAAAIGLANIDLAKRNVHLHLEAAKFYSQALAGLEPRIRLAPFNSGSSYWVYTILVDDRDSFVKFMTENEIEVSQVHRRNDEHPAFIKAAGGTTHLPGLDEFASHQISIPCGWWMTTGDLNYVIEKVKQWATS